ncbi:hypothetical protein ACHAPO_011986 [Fusarium lateritium]
MGSYWECSVCPGIETTSTFLTGEAFASHTREKHQDTISDDDITFMQESCRKVYLPNIRQCPLCPWPEDQEIEPDATANLEHIGNCIHEFSLKALPWADYVTAEGSAMIVAVPRYVRRWLYKSTAEDANVQDICKVDITKFRFFQPIITTDEQRNTYKPEEYVAESSKETPKVDDESISLDSEFPEVRGTYSDDENLSPIPDEENQTADQGKNTLPLKETHLMNFLNPGNYANLDMEQLEVLKESISRRGHSIIDEETWKNSLGVESMLGQEGSAKVYRLRRRSTGEEHAMTLIERRNDGSELNARNKIIILQSVRHSNIVEIVASFTSPSYFGFFTTCGRM